MTTRISLSMVLLASIVLNVSIQSTQAASIEALNFANGGNYDVLNPAGAPLINYTVGWTFTVNSPVSVTSLGYFDGTATGFHDTHAVGIYNASGALLTSATVSATDTLVPSTGSQPSNGFRYDSSLSAPLTLLPGNTYTIGGEIGTQGDGFWGQASGVTTPSQVNYGGGVYVFGGSLAWPTTASNQGVSYFGPSFQFAATPEPSSICLLGLATASLFAVGRRRRSA